DPDGAGYQQDARWNGVMQRVEERVNALPGVRASGFAFSVFSGGGWTGGVTVPGRPKNDHDREVVHNIVGAGYLEAMGMPIVLGRGLVPEDSASSHKVAVINETMARAYFGGESPLGRSFSVGSEKGWLDLEVVGVVKDAKYMELREEPMNAAFY